MLEEVFGKKGGTFYLTDAVSWPVPSRYAGLSDGDYTIGVLERDMGIGAADLEPGRGRVLDSLKSVLFAAPILFHFLRWTMKFGELVLGHGQKLP